MESMEKQEVITNCSAHTLCPVADTLNAIGGRWTLLILHNLFDGTKRFGQLQRALGGISPKTLSLRLKELENQRLISKKVYAQVPLRVDYTLTPKGESLREVFDKLGQWSEKHI